MDSYDLFGEDGSGMLEGLADLGGTDNFPDNSAPTVTGGTRDPSERSYRQTYSQGTAQPEGSLQKLASFGSGGGVAGTAPQAPPTGGSASSEYTDYGAYPPRPRLPHPPHPPHPSHHPPHLPHPPHSYPTYHAGPDPLYSMPEHPGMGEIGVWPGAPGAVRGYPPAAQAYRHPYDQQKMHQYPPQQGSNMGLQAMTQSGSYLQRQPHYVQPTTQQMYAQQQSYPGYNQLHPQNVSRIGQHAPYHQQMELNPHQYGHVHGQQGHPGVPPHQSHQTMTGHQGSIAPQPGLQNHTPVHLHHSGAAPLHHATPARQPSAPPSSVASAPVSAPPSPYGQPPHHSMAMNYQPHQLQRSLDVNVGVANQYSTVKGPVLDGGSPQYRTPFPQISPQMSPRAQVSPRQQASQMSPRPAMSPAKGPNASPHSSRPPLQSPAPTGPSGPPPSSGYNPQSTLQALEQMVMPGSGEYPYQRNPASPALGRMPSSPQPWSQNRMPASVNGAMDNVIPSENIAQHTTPNEIVNQGNVEDAPLNTGNVEPDNENKTIEQLNKNDECMKSTESLISSDEKPPNSLNESKNVDSKSSFEDDKEQENHHLNAPTMTISAEYAPKVHENLDNISNTRMLNENVDKDQCGSDVVNHCKLSPVLANEAVMSASNNEKEPNIQGPEGPCAGLINAPKSMMHASGSTLSSILPAISASQGSPHALSLTSQLIVPPSIIPGAAPNIYETVQGMTMPPGNHTLPAINNLQTCASSNMPNTMPPGIATNIPTNLQGNVLSNMPANLVPNIQSSLQTNAQTLASTLSSSLNLNIPTIPPNLSTSSIPSNISASLPSNILPPNITNNLQPNMQPNAQPNMPTNMQCIPPLPTMPGSLPQNLPPNIQQNMTHMIMGPAIISHPNIGALYQPPISHHQERAALQQQIQEIFCMPPSPENQDKVRLLQERLAMLQQHEANEKCNGGPTCILQNPIYGSTMIESPQVSSTTGRGRVKGPPRPRKPRTKKEKSNLAASLQAIDQLPVSEDCVTAGTGIQVQGAVIDIDLNGDLTNLDNTVSPYELGKDGKPKKPRAPRKPRERKPRPPKEPKQPRVTKEKSEKPQKDRKSREPKDPNAPKRKRNAKKEPGEVLADTTTNLDLNVSTDIDSSSAVSKQSISESLAESTINHSESDRKSVLDQLAIDDSVTDFDDIPVSKIAIKDLLEEAEAKREREEKEDDTDSTSNSPSKKRGSSKKRSVGNSISKKSAIRKSSGGRKKKRGGIVPDSDGEPDDLISTPPPSPPAEGDCDSSKRRSARHTQRKKYTDDVMLRLSDDEYPILLTHRQGREIKPKEVKSNETLDLESGNVNDAKKPNYVYVNTSEEDTMIVQHVLTCRMGKREMQLEPPIIIKPPAANPSVEDDKEVVSEGISNVKMETLTNDDADKKEDTKVTIDQLEIDEDDIPEKPAPCVPKLETKIIESIAKNETEVTPSENSEISKPKLPPVMVDVEEYFVKFRNFSYLHCEWKTEEELYKGDKRIFSKIKRFKQKQAQQVNMFELFDDEHFNPDYVEVERVLAVSDLVDPATQVAIKHYFVKWKGLQYEDSTWELVEDVDEDKVKQFEIFNAVPPKEKWKFKRRPNPDQWLQLTETPTYKGGNTLRPYQLEGLNWLLFSWYNNRNCILADEMGLGKTIQSLTFVHSVWEYGIRGPFLIIAPLSTIPNWQREFEGWTDMNVIVYHGSQHSKSMIQEFEFYYKNEKGEIPSKDITKFNVLITTFEIIVTDFQDLKNFNWRICVIDEAHRLKNRNCKLLEGLRQLPLEHRVLLSGTPLQNNVNELFSLLNFLEPSQFSSCEAFLTEFGQLKSESEVLKLQALLKPMMLRRLKEDVEKSLAPKEETVIEVELTNIQKKYYRGILERNFSFLTKGTASAANIPNLMNTMMELRKCCIHPYLLNGAEEQIQFDYRQSNGEDHEAYYKALIQSSGKMVLVDKLLPKLKAGGHRVLVFSQMVRCLDILEDYLLYRKYPYERIDGRIRGNLRQEAIDRFSKPDSDRFVFLLCTKAGGLGINLTAADTVIIYDSDWNPQNDLQAQARCHRIGQQKMVKIYRLICRNTYEREMFDKASMKLGLDKAILQSMNTAQGKDPNAKQLTKKEIEDLLKKGAYGAVMDEDNAGDKFCEEDIEMILARRTLVIQMESEKGSTFSKASFASTDQRSDIDIRDPDFWNKWAKKAEIDITEKKEDEDLIVMEPRRRTLIKRYGHDDGTVDVSDTEVTPDTDEEGEGISLRSKRRRDKFGRKGRKYNSDDYIPRHEGIPIDEEVVYGSWARSECFKIERGLLTFGWARWDEILDKNQFRKGWTAPVIEDCARIIVLYCLRHYKGDEKIRNFIWDLIEPCENGEVTISRNHSGLHNPVPRGRNAKKKIKPKDLPKPNAPQKWEDPSHWSSAEKYDCEAYLEGSYKKHLFRHANKVLLRVRMMYYIKHEVIGEFAQQLEGGVHASAVGMRVPRAVESAPPRIWWDSTCDVSLLVGTYLHGYENYLAMRSDPQLCFVEKLGPPDDAERTNIQREETSVGAGAVCDEDGTDEVSSGAGAVSPAPSPRPDDDSTQGSSGGHPWPSMQDLNTRLRRLITAYQRNYKKEELKMQQRAKLERRERMEQLAREEAAQWRWARADEEAFRRTVASYGVEFDPATKSLRWGRFRALARLDTKSDDALTDYLKAFMAMCKRQCGLTVGEAELPTRADLRAEPIGEERAIATLERIDLLRVLREEVAPHAALDARLALCEPAPVPHAPPWWQPARHDKLLVLGVCKHGLGDTYHKLFCDPKMPFADCARKWSESNKLRAKRDSRKMSSEDEDEDILEETLEAKNEDRPALRRSKRNSNASEKDNIEDDRDALSELETLARLGRTDATPPASHWFSERALETRLHHIAHAVQNGEWPAAARTQRTAEPAQVSQQELQEERRRPRKQHIAIDVETERAKLHALLSSPHPVSQHSAHTSRAVERATSIRVQVDSGDPAPTTSAKQSGGWDRDDASSDSGSRRSTPAPTLAPPPAHQRPAPSPAPPSSSAAPVDLSAPLDLSEAQDFSMGRRTPGSELIANSALTTALGLPLKGKLEDTLSKLMKRKNAPEPEVIVGKEKKRRKLDEIVLGLSAAKGRSPMESAASAEPMRKHPPVLPNVTVTPAAPPSSSPAPSPIQKPFSVTVTSVPSPHAQPKELSSFLQQSLEQAGLLKSHKSVPAPAKPYSHEAKVNKWLAEQAGVDSRRRAVGPRLAPDEHVPVLHRVTGKRLVGHKAPQLKHLAHWITENPMYDIDPKWTDSVKEFVKLPQDVRSQRPSPMPSTSASGERKKGRPPSLDTSSNVGSSYSSLGQNMSGLNPSLLAGLSGLGAFDPKTLAATLSNLTGFDPKALGSFDPKLLANLSSFDPKNNPLLMPFNSMPNMLGNMTGGNVFANLASLSLPGFSGVDMANLGVTSSSADGSSSGKTKGRKPGDTNSSSNKASNMSSGAQFPFVFPNPNLLYPQLGLSSLNPFGMQSGISSAYDALAQCGLLNGSISSSSSTTTAHSTSHSSSRNSSKVTPSRSSSVTSATTTMSSKHQKASLERHQAQLQQLLLPSDTYLLESLTKHAPSYEAALKAEKRNREAERRDMAADLSKSDKRKPPSESYRTQLPAEFAAVQERLLKSSKGDKKDVDISKMLFEQVASGALSASLVTSAQSKRTKEIESKDAFEKLSKTSAEYIARSLTSEEAAPAGNISHKRLHEDIRNEPENLVMHSTDLRVPKKMKENEETESNQPPAHVPLIVHSETPTNTGEMDLEDLIAPSTVIRSGPKPSNEPENMSLKTTQAVQMTAHASPPPAMVPEKPPSPTVEDNPPCEEASAEPSESDYYSASGEKSERNDDCKETGNDSTDGSVPAEDAGENSDGSRKVNRKRGRRSADEGGGGSATGAAGVRRELRSSASRQAAAAAARHAAQPH